MNFHRFKIFPLKNNKFNIINVICSSRNLKRRGRYLSLNSFQPPNVVSCWLSCSTWSTLGRSIYTSLVKYQILRKRKTRSKQSLVAFLGVQGQQGRVLHAAAAAHEESWKHSVRVGTGVVQTVLWDAMFWASLRASGFHSLGISGRVMFNSASAKWKGNKQASAVEQSEC